MIPKIQNNLHLAVKKIPHFDLHSESMIAKPPVNNGVKLEAFIFDAVEEADSVQLFEVDRESEFCPMKNLTGEDSLETGTMIIERLIQAASNSNKLWHQIYQGEECL